MNFASIHKDDEARCPSFQDKFVVGQSLTEAGALLDLDQVVIAVLEIYHYTGPCVPAVDNIITYNNRKIPWVKLRLHMLELCIVL